MSWQERDYAREPARGGGRWGGHGGLSSWFGGASSGPTVVKGIVIANVVLYLLCQLTGGGQGLVFGWTAMQTNAVLDGQIWRLVTWTYMHAPDMILHIVFNMLGLYLLGTHLERHWGPRRFFVFYTLAGLAAVLLYFVLTLTMPDQFPRDGVLIGASGGVLAVVGACAVLFPRIQLIVVFYPMPIRTFVVLFGGIYALNVLVGGFNSGGDVCHLAGLAFGVAWGYRGEQWIQAFRRRRIRFRPGP